MNHILAISCAFALVTGCAVLESPQEPKISVFDEAVQTFDTVRQAAKLCRVQVDGPAEKHQCPGQVAQFDSRACLAFDALLQPALEPIKYCSEATEIESSDELSRQCEDYIRQFLDPCIGVHGMHIAHNDIAASKRYREAIETGTDETLARETLLAEIVRYRD